MTQEQNTTVKGSASGQRQPGLRRGDEVIYHGCMPALVLEDRGPLGGEGRHVFRIAVFPDDAEQRDEFEAVEDSLRSVA